MDADGCKGDRAAGIDGGRKGMKIYFAPMEGITDGILRRAHHEIFGGADVYCLPFHKLTQTFSLTAREERDIAPEENEGLNVLPQALTGS